MVLTLGGEVVKSSKCQKRVRLIIVTDKDFWIDSKTALLIALESCSSFAGCGVLRNARGV